MVLMIKPSVGLTLFTSSFMIFFTIVVFPALSSPLQTISSGHTRRLGYSQHQDPHLLVLETSLPENRQHPGYSTFLSVSVGRKESLTKESQGVKAFEDHVARKGMDVSELKQMVCSALNVLTDIVLAIISAFASS
jgi:hypothetical protein